MKKIILIGGILVIIALAAFLMLSSDPKEGGVGIGGFSLDEFLPFGSNNLPDTTGQAPSNNNEQGDSELSDINTPQSIPRLRKLSNEPVAGAAIFNIGTTTIVRFVEKGTGNVYQARSNSGAVERLTNTTIPKIVRAYWLPDGSGFLAQTLSDESNIVETSFIKLSRATSSVENITPFDTSISKLPTGIKEILIKPDGTKIFYYVITQTGSSWYISNPDGTGKVQTNTHSLIEWIPLKWVGNSIFMQTKPAYNHNSYIYSFDTVSKNIKRVGSGNGMSAAINSSGSTALASGGGSNPNLYTIDVKNGHVSELSSNTISEKCVWMNKSSNNAICGFPKNFPSGTYPDSWYQGLTSTEDYIQRVDLSNDIYYDAIDLSKVSGQKIDMTDVAISQDDAYLIFRNKIDGYLWMLQIQN